MLIRSNVLEHSIETKQLPMMRSFPELIDIGIMGACNAGKSGLCRNAGVDCYQRGMLSHETNMSLDDYCSIIAQCGGRTFQIALGGAGDPNKHESFAEILRATRENRIVPNYTTSGYNLTDREIELTKTYCSAVAVSYCVNSTSSIIIYQDVIFTLDYRHGFLLLVPMAVFFLHLLLCLLAFLPIRQASIALAQIHQPLRFRNLRFHLHDQHFQLLLALLAGMGIDIAGVLLTVGPFWGIATFEEVVVDLADTAGTGSALAAHLGLEVGHTRLFRLGWGSFLPRL